MRKIELREKNQRKTKITFQTKRTKIIDLEGPLNSKINDCKNILHNTPSQSFIRNITEIHIKVRRNEEGKRKHKYHKIPKVKSCFSVVTYEARRHEARPSHQSSCNFLFNNEER